MKLTYRGVPYNATPAQAKTAETGLTGKYRGQTVRFHKVQELTVPQPVLQLQYRGVAYQTTASGQAKAAAPASVSPQTVSAFRPSRSTSARRALLNEVSRIHRDNIQRRLQHRLDVARAQGNQPLVHQLEAEMHQMA